jgi:hypothetical protein
MGLFMLDQMILDYVLLTQTMEIFYGPVCQQAVEYNPRQQLVQMGLFMLDQMMGDFMLLGIKD